MTPAPQPPSRESTHAWHWRKYLPHRKDQRCSILARGKLNSVLIQFEDGEKVVTNRYAVRRLKP